MSLLPPHRRVAPRAITARPRRDRPTRLVRIQREFNVSHRTGHAIHHANERINRQFLHVGVVLERALATACGLAACLHPDGVARAGKSKTK